MVGVSLSRWTMSYFVAALVSLLAAQALMAAGYGFPNAPMAAPQTLVVVHIVVIGWLSLLMCGALFQFAPVLVAKPLYSNALPLPTLVFLITGLIALVLGFLQLDGTVAAGVSALPPGAILLGIGFALALWNLARTLLSARPLPLPARFIGGGLLGLAATAGLGIIFALVLGAATTALPLAKLTAAGVPLHAALGLGGWLTFSATGVSYRLLAMFMLAPDLERPSTRAALLLAAIALAVLIGAALAIALGDRLDMALPAAGALGLAALVLYGADVMHLYRFRKRPKIELNSRMAAWALGSLAASVLLMIALLAMGRLSQEIGAVVFLLAFGWLSGLGLAQVYKIVAFLTWLECYGPVLGKTATPRVQDLVVEPRAFKWFVLYFVAVWAATVALFAQAPLTFQAAAAAMFVGTTGIVAQIVRARRLADVSAAFRLAAGTRRPRLLFSLSQQT